MGDNVIFENARASAWISGLHRRLSDGCIAICVGRGLSPRSLDQIEGKFLVMLPVYPLIPYVELLRW